MLENQTKDQDQDRRQRWMNIFAAIEGLNAMKRKHNLMLDQQINEEWVVFALKYSEGEVFCKRRAAWDNYLKKYGHSAPPSNMTLLAEGVTEEIAKKMKELANGE